MVTNLDMDCLRTFSAIAALGSFAKAAERVGRTVPAVSLQISRLETSIGKRLFRKEGRRMVLSAVGEEFLGHAKAILAANDAAARAIADVNFSGVVRVGAVQDFAEDELPQLLAAFGSLYPEARIDVLVERSRVLVDALEAGKLDHAIAFKQNTAIKSEALGNEQMVWLGPRDTDVAAMRPLPLVLIEGPCAFREAAITALSDAGVPWQIRLSSPSLSCLAAAVEAGVGIGVRTRQMLGRRWRGLAEVKGLPTLPKAGLRYYRNDSPGNPAADLFHAFCGERLFPGLPVRAGRPDQ